MPLGAHSRWRLALLPLALLAAQTATTGAQARPLVESSPAVAGAPATVPHRDPAIDLAAAYLHRAIEPDGRFRYTVDAITGEVGQGRYNVLRHAGSLLALAEYHQQWPPTPEQIRTVERSLSFLRRCCLAPGGPGAEGKAVWSPPELVGGARRYPVAKLGGAGLTLAALAQWRRVNPQGVNLEEMRALARYLVSQQRADGSFESLHAHHSGQHDPDWVSLYYPGEAALGLVLLHEHDPQGGWLVPAVDALRHLARLREGVETPPPDHWALVATARLFARPAHEVQAALPPGLLWQEGDGPDNARGWLMAHARAVVRAMLAEQAAARSGCAPGAFTADGRPAPTATRLEGLTAIVPWWPPGAERDALLAAIEDGVRFLRAAQWRLGPAAGGFSRTAPVCSRGARRDAEVRMDQVQHAMAALMGARALETCKAADPSATGGLSLFACGAPVQPGSPTR